MKIALPRKVMMIIKNLQHHGYEAYAVGGCVRDSILARRPKDWDITTCLLYTSLVYSMLDLPPALYTPIFAAARIVGWSAHRLEELKNVDKIIRPAYKPLAPYRDYIKLDDR